MFLFQLGYRYQGEQVIGVESHQLNGTDAIRLDLFASGTRDAGKYDYITVIAFFGKISLQGMASMIGLITESESADGKAFMEPVKLAQRSL